MRKTVGIVLMFIVFFLFAGIVKAEKIAGGSALISYNENQSNAYTNSTIKKLTIKRLLERYSSPLLGATDAFINACTTYNLDCYLLPSITGLESFFGKYVYPGSANPFGWGGGYIVFDKWEDSVMTVGKGLRENYINKGADTVEKIAPIYASNPAWADKVKYFMAQFEKEEENVRLLLGQNTVQL
ncbi:glucosaminidase domain-containing protein [Candidatus Roizmanbacteria bacterium]|jgi:hypothetical protein|nr:glucosaminidase domain-containing protein [Candidatus Roizmanbacteria bacterium]